MKALFVHYKNKYPNGRVEMSEDKLDAYCSENIHRVALRKGGDGQLLDKSAEYGAVDGHDLSPIPKNCRVFKLNQDGTVGTDEKAKERIPVSEQAQVKGKILSIEEYKKAGFDVKENGELVFKKAAPVVSQELDHEQ